MKLTSGFVAQISHSGSKFKALSQQLIVNRRNLFLLNIIFILPLYLPKRNYLTK
ncbi:NADH dehydrogenase subunit L [Nodularia spumigena CCY9414]|nr:NADH dehydrogenase subunit L [Nodularia spumigena CCY9414]EAW44519.1 NADH dehydrogenase subunit L [Nodularia spumigena CCY9414]